MNGYRVFLPLFLIAAIMTGCATPRTEGVAVNDALVEAEAKKQRQIALESLMNDQIYLEQVAYPIQVAGSSFCGEAVKPAMGFHFANKHAIPKDFHDAAVSLYDMGEPLQVTHVIPGSPAGKAGIQKGDILVALNGEKMPVGKTAVKEAAELMDDQLKPGESVTLTVLRKERERDFALVPEEACNYPVFLNTSDQVNAMADGSKIIIARGMMRFVENDQELGMVISHELAHNAMAHMKALKQNYMLGSIFDIVGMIYGINTQGLFGKLGAQRYSKEFEAEADYVSLYIMARAGLDIDKSPHFWRRMATAHPGSIEANHASSHPSTPERFVALEKTIEEIREKEASGSPLEPEYKK
ncbi:MAG: M48 family metalloprotease [bacterium]|nr:M48 family metalloprotease [bacterium]